jgi:hypothetical protein
VGDLEVGAAVVAQLVALSVGLEDLRARAFGLDRVA